MLLANVVHQELTPLINQINNHTLYEDIKTLSDLRIFMQHHVFAVWDFMCLLKTLHNKLVCTQTPWFPPFDAQSANLITSILVEEEGDLMPDGKHYKSHFEIYLEAMQEIDANVKPIRQLLLYLKPFSLQDALIAIDIPDSAKKFVNMTFSFFDLPVHQLASAFVFGREAITQMMFQPLLNQLQNKLPREEQPKLKLIQYYFSRHIELDSETHFPRSLQMLNQLCGEDQLKWRETTRTALQALRAREEFLSAIQTAIRSSGQ